MMLIPTGAAFSTIWDDERAQWVVRCGGVVIVPTRAHNVCVTCGRFRIEHDALRAGLINDHAYLADDASERAPKLCEVLNRLYGAPTCPHGAKIYAEQLPRTDCPFCYYPMGLLPRRKRVCVELCDRATAIQRERELIPDDWRTSHFEDGAPKYGWGAP